MEFDDESRLRAKEFPGDASVSSNKDQQANQMEKNNVYVSVCVCVHM